jgi:hypothetical protein
MVLLLICMGCAAAKPRPSDPGLFLLKPADAGVTLELTQSLVFSKGETRSESLAAIEISPEAVAVVGLSPLGNRVLALRWDGTHYEEERDPSLPKDLPLKLILRDMMTAFWPADAVRAKLGKGWSLADEEGCRTLFDAGQAVIRIHYQGADHWHSPALFEHLALGYKLEITPLAEE